MKILCALGLVALPSLAGGQSPVGGSDSSIVHATGAFIAVSVADLDASEKWYTEKLSLKRVMQGGRTGRLGGFVVLEGNGLIIELVKHDDSIRPSSSSAELVQGFFKAGAIVADFDRTAALLRAGGVEIVIGPFAARETVRANLVFKDNAGNLVQLFGDYARK
jgi:catechol 2,3-dioxygenase-like lactoylglutathione lyase family enzyme